LPKVARTALLRIRPEDIRGWFTEGFDTKGMQEATALLEELT
jgi:hypothetical protein